MYLYRTKRTETPVTDLTARNSLSCGRTLPTTRRELIEARETADKENTEALLHGGHFDATWNRSRGSRGSLAGLESELNHWRGRGQQKRTRTGKRQRPRPLALRRSPRGIGRS